ncbi:MAG: hypothetical protein WD118_11335 [Phycisphaeraceae bacterium]
MPDSTYARVSRARKRLAEQGGRRMDLRLSPDANAAAAQLAAVNGESVTAVINRLLIDAARKH